jgi:microcystin-dependent protein
MVGLNAADPDFQTAEQTGGAKTHQLSVAEMPAHTHVQDAHTHVQNAHQHTAITASNTAGTSGASITRGSGTQATVVTSNATAVNQNATAVNQSTGGGAAHPNVQPYIVCRFWKRTA